MRCLAKTGPGRTPRPSRQRPSIGATLLPGGNARAEEARRIALGAYREGAVPLFQVIDAARTWGEARLTYYRTLYAQHQSVLALLAAEGSDLFAPSSITTLSEPVR